MNAKRLLAYYERVADAPDAIPKLRRFVLELAVRGKLVEQDPADEPAPELLRRISNEKRKLRVDEPTDRGRKDRLSSIPPPSEPYVQISRIRLSGR